MGGAREESKRRATRAEINKRYVLKKRRGIEARGEVMRRRLDEEQDLAIKKAHDEIASTKARLTMASFTQLLAKTAVGRLLVEEADND